MAHTTKYRDGDTFKGAIALPEVLEDDGTLYSNSKILSLAIAAEEFVLSFGDISPSTTASQNCFDAACRDVMIRFISNPTISSISKIGENREEFKELASVQNWARNYGGGSGAAGLSLNYFSRRC